MPKRTEVEGIAEQLAEDGDFLPVVTKPIPGYHGGFLQSQSDADRGLTLFVQMNEARDVLWVQPTTVGGCNDFGVADAKEFAKELGESPIITSP